MSLHANPQWRFLFEIRRRLIYCLLVLSGFFLGLLYFANTLYTWLALPLLNYLPAEHGLIATNVVAPFFVPLELSFYVALFLASPFVLYQVWGFVAPALYQHEKKWVWLLLLLSSFLFYLGMTFAYFVVFPILFKFLLRTVPLGVWLSPDISLYLDFALKLLFVFGVIFQIPVLTVLLIKTGLVTRAKLVSLRPYIIVGAFVVGMLVGPPDVLSQTLLALPMWLLFEIGLLIARNKDDRSRKNR